MRPRQVYFMLGTDDPYWKQIASEKTVAIYPAAAVRPQQGQDHPHGRARARLGDGVLKESRAMDRVNEVTKDAFDALIQIRNLHDGGLRARPRCSMRG